MFCWTGDMLHPVNIPQLRRNTPNKKKKKSYNHGREVGVLSDRSAMCLILNFNLLLDDLRVWWGSNKQKNNQNTSDYLKISIERDPNVRNLKYVLGLSRFPFILGTATIEYKGPGDEYLSQIRYRAFQSNPEIQNNILIHMESRKYLFCFGVLQSDK